MESPDLSYGCIICPAHIDELGHLHYTRYADYFDIGREALQHQFGVSNSKLAEQGLELVVGEWKIEHLREVLPGSRVIVYSKIIPLGRGVKFFIEQEMYLDDTLVATETIKNGFTRKINGERVVARPPAEFVRKIKKGQ